MTFDRINFTIKSQKKKRRTFNLIASNWICRWRQYFFCGFVFCCSSWISHSNRIAVSFHSFSYRFSSVITNWNLWLPRASVRRTHHLTLTTPRVVFEWQKTKRRFQWRRKANRIGNCIFDETKRDDIRRLNEKLIDHNNVVWQTMPSVTWVRWPPEIKIHRNCCFFRHGESSATTEKYLWKSLQQRDLFTSRPWMSSRFWPTKCRDANESSTELFFIFFFFCW